MHVEETRLALDMPMTKAMEKVFEYLPEILDCQKFAGHAGIDRNVQTVNSIPKPGFMMKLNEVLLAQYFIIKEV